MVLVRWKSISSGMSIELHNLPKFNHIRIHPWPTRDLTSRFRSASCRTRTDPPQRLRRCVALAAFVGFSKYLGWGYCKPGFSATSSRTTCAIASPILKEKVLLLKI